MRRYGIVGVEMEAAGSYGVAAECSVEALAICTVSDDITGGAVRIEHMTAEFAKHVANE